MSIVKVSAMQNGQTDGKTGRPSCWSNMTAYMGPCVTHMDQKLVTSVCQTYGTTGTQPELVDSVLVFCDGVKCLSCQTYGTTGTQPELVDPVLVFCDGVKCLSC